MRGKGPDRRDSSHVDVAELTEILGWELPETGWEQVAHVLAELGNALSGKDPERIAAALDSLAFSGPLRLRTWLGDAPSVPAPEEIRERVNRLVQDLEAGDDERTSRQ